MYMPRPARRGSSRIGRQWGAALAVLAVLPRSWLNPAAMRREEHALCGLKVVVNAKRSKPLTP